VKEGLECDELAERDMPPRKVRDGIVAYRCRWELRGVGGGRVERKEGFGVF